MIAIRSSSYLFIFSLCLFMHARNANAGRPFGFTFYNKFPHQYHRKIHEEKFKVSSNSANPNIIRHAIGNIGMCSNNSGNTMNLHSKEEETSCHKNKGVKGANSGNEEDCKSFLDKDDVTINSTKSEGAKLMSVRDGKELNSSIFSEEALLATDYLPPHRKTPIHNK